MKDSISFTLLDDFKLTNTLIFMLHYKHVFSSLLIVDVWIISKSLNEHRQNNQRVMQKKSIYSTKIRNICLKFRREEYLNK